MASFTDAFILTGAADFFKHGDILTIERANGVRRSEIWFLLNDFSMVLATIITSKLFERSIRKNC